MSHTPLDGRHAVAVALGLPLGVGVFSLPHGVENLAGPATPLAYLAGTVAVCALALAYAVFLSSPLAHHEGVAYAAVSRTWGSRSLGVLSAWPAVGAYVAILAVLVAALGRSLAAAVGAPGLSTPASLAVLGALVAVHALGPAVAGRAQLWVTGTLLALLVGMILVGFTAVVLGNFSPLLPTPTLRLHPVDALGAATSVTLFGFVGFDAGAAVSTAVRAPRRTAPRALFAAVLVAGALSVLATFVTLGVIPWSRLVFATAPFAEATASALDVAPRRLLAPGTALATVGAALATVWLPTRAIRGLSEVIPGLDRTTPPGVPDPALATVGLLAGAVVAADIVGYALYLALAGAFVHYAAVALSAAALPVVRPALYRRCRLRPPASALAVGGLLAFGAAVLVLARVLVLDPATSLGFTRWAPALSAVDTAVLVRDPLSTVVPAVLLWELVGVAVVAVAADYRADRGIERPPLDAAYEE